MLDRQLIGHDSEILEYATWLGIDVELERVGPACVPSPGTENEPVERPYPCNTGTSMTLLGCYCS